MPARLRPHRGFILLNILFLLIYALICFVNHYNYRTYALDLGAYTRTVYDYAHFRPSYGEVFRAAPENVLSDHFDLVLILVSPLWWLFGNITLLVVQLLAIHLGCLGVYRLCKYYQLTGGAGLLACAAFLSYFGIFSAVAFDYHSSVVAACLLPWLSVFFLRGRRWQLLAVFLLILFAKENMSLWLFFVCSGLAWLQRKNRPLRNMAMVLAAASMFFFIAVLFLIMPAFATNKQYSHMEFHVLGNSFGEMLLAMLRDPLQACSLLFRNHLPDPSFDNIKAETWIFWLISGGFLMLYRPVFLWMVLPVMMQKMYHDDPAKWSVAQQYNIEFAPLLAWCFAEVAGGKQHRTQLMLGAVVVLCCAGVTVRLCDNTVGFVDKTRIRFYQADHYRSDFVREDVREVMALIPDAARVSAQSMFVPHLVSKKAVYQFPIVRDAEYILLSDDIHAWPLGMTALRKQIDSLQKRPGQPAVCVKNGLYLFRVQP
jgi:uncharacterized membrane protein